MDLANCVILALIVVLLAVLGPIYPLLFYIFLGYTAIFTLILIFSLNIYTGAIKDKTYIMLPTLFGWTVVAVLAAISSGITVWALAQ